MVGNTVFYWKVNDMELTELRNLLKTFIDEWWGTSIGQSIYYKVANTRDDDYDRLMDIYMEIEDLI